MEIWVILSLLYGLLCGTSDIVKKQALQKTDVYNVLFLFNFICLILTIPTVNNFYISLNSFILILIKSFCVFLGWLIGFKMLKIVPISLYGILMLSKIIFTGLLGIIFLNESLSVLKITGMVIIILGILLSNLKIKNSYKCSLKNVLLVLLSSFLISISVFLDKVILINLTPENLQFYYIILLLIFYQIFMLINKTIINFKHTYKNLYIPSLSIISYLADKCHFNAAHSVNASVTVMTLLRQSSIIISVVVGGIIYKENKLLLKIISCIIVVFGLVLTII